MRSYWLLFFFLRHCLGRSSLNGPLPMALSLPLPKPGISIHGAVDGSRRAGQGQEEGAAGGWRCPQFEEHPAVECSCDLPHTLRCTGDWSAMQIIGRTLRSLPSHRAVSLLDCTVQNVSALSGPLLEGVALHGLVVSSGEIRDVHSAAFRGLAAPLQALGLPNNQLITVPTEALAMLTGLDRLDLSYNKLKTIELNSFEGLSNLTFLELSENQLATLVPGCFRPLRFLSTLRLRGNRLETSALAALKDLLSLSELDLSANKLTGPLGPSSLPGLKGLHLLQLGENSYTSIKRGALAGLINLTSLSLRHNQIDVLEDHAFRQLCNLTELDLAHNGIVAVSGNSLAHLVHLQKLDLAHNFLRALTADLIKPLIALRELRLDDNDISIVAGDSLGPTNVLDRLTLSDNPLNCDCSLSDFAAWLRANTHLSSLDRTSAVCTTPPHLEGAALRSLSHRSLSCGGDVSEEDSEEFKDDECEGDEGEDYEEVESVLEREESEVVTTVYTAETHTEALISGEEEDYDFKVSREQVTLSEFNYDGTLVRLRWDVTAKSLPYTCDAVFVYEEHETKESIISSEPLHCDSNGMPEPRDLRVTVPGSRDLKIGHKYRYCIALMQGSRDSDELNLMLGCSDIIPLHPTTTSGEIVRKEPTVRVSGVRSNVTSGGTLSIEISLFGYPPNRPQNLKLQNGVDPSDDQIAEYFEALNNCYVSLAVLAQGSLIAQSDTQCDNTFVKMEGFMEGPYKVCASLSEFQVTGPNTKCVLAQKVGKVDMVHSSAMGLNVTLIASCIGLIAAVVVFVCVFRKLLKKPKQIIVQSHQCFVAETPCDDVQHSRYVKLHATTKL